MESIIHFIKHALGFCGEHWHPNVFTLVASVPIVGPAIYYVKCKCGGWLNHKKNCKHEEK